MYRYHNEHTWVKMNGELALVGLSFYAQAHLGEIVFVDVPAPGTRIKAGAAMCGIESAKTTSEIIAPVNGKIVESNSELEAHPELVNESPLDKGWVVKIQPDSLAEIENLMDAKSYEAFLSAQAAE